MTVAVIDPKAASEIEFNERDFKIEWYSGTGCGGQYRNKHQNSCRITHIQTGMVATAQHRSRENSLKEAKAAILARLSARVGGEVARETETLRKAQVGSGMRGDKFRTYRFQDGSVKDTRTGKSASIEKVLSGRFDLLW